MWILRGVGDFAVCTRYSTELDVLVFVCVRVRTYFCKYLSIFFITCIDLLGSQKEKPVLDNKLNTVFWSHWDVTTQKHESSEWEVFPLIFQEQSNHVVEVHLLSCALSDIYARIC